MTGQRGSEQQVAIRSVILASADAGLRQRLNESLTTLRWTVREATGGADAMAQVERLRPEALIVDNWLPDLEAGEFTGHMREMYPAMELLRVDGSQQGVGTRSPRRNELLHALREAQDGGPALASEVEEPIREIEAPVYAPVSVTDQALPEMIGQSASMRELARMIRLVAPRSATVLIEGETGTGKEVVAKAVHRLSGRAAKPFAVLNCAAIPEALLEAELFGHTRGAFTGAVQSRTGRIEAANGGTLFLDEIGEMPLALQAKMLRFLECGELQRVGDNETMRVDVRVIAATHQPLEQRAGERLFRLDLYHRLAVFPLEVPALRDRMSDLGLLVDFFLEKMGREMPRKRISAGALAKLGAYHWPGNVRELMHVLERAAILVEERAEIGVDEIRFGARMSA
jgi:transcriptional regulator with GAF, ATPase, and Fis domain